MFIVFDLDGTLANIDHRRHLVSKDRRDPQWQEFFQRCVDDTPIRHMVQVFWALMMSDDDHRIEIWSGRSDEVLRETREWLLNHVTANTGMLTRMRPAVNTEPDDVLKESWLRALPPDERPELVFDDRDKVVAMWRRNGIPCLQVAPGNF
jgi:phosphoglycolate phosphatase-like HAD superfamily hydrolase